MNSRGSPEKTTFTPSAVGVPCTSIESYKPEPYSRRRLSRTFLSSSRSPGCRGSWPGSGESIAPVTPENWIDVTLRPANACRPGSGAPVHCSELCVAGVAGSPSGVTTGGSVFVFGADWAGGAGCDCAPGVPDVPCPGVVVLDGVCG